MSTYVTTLGLYHLYHLLWMLVSKCDQNLATDSPATHATFGGTSPYLHLQSGEGISDLPR
jgi:hypothetical protein